MTKQAAATLSEAWQNHKLLNNGDQTTAFSDLTPYFNYVAIQTTGTFSGVSCTFGPTTYCIKTHEGGMFFSLTDSAFDGTTDADTIGVFYDPDFSTEKGLGTDRIILTLTYPGRVFTTGDAGGPADPSWWEGW